MKLKRGYYDDFVRTCAACPTNIAVHLYTDEHYKTYTYSELYGVCEYIAQNLQQVSCSKGVIGILTERNLITPCVIAAAHKCSTTFMFLDPLQDLGTVMKKVKFKTIISVDSDKDRFMNRLPDKTITVFDITVRFYDFSSISKQSSKVKHTFSFISSTSGSTGEPKHIQVPVQCLQPNIQDLTKLFKITSEDIIYFSTPLTFDPSMIEVLLAFTNGASLLIAPESIDLMFPANTKHSITFWQTTPSKFLQHSNADIAERILSCKSTLKYLALGGEPLNSIQRLKSLKSPGNKTQIYSLYGVTEMSCWACAAELDLSKMDDNTEIPLGQCLSETELKIQDISDNKGIGNILLSSRSRKCIFLNSSPKDSALKKGAKYLDTGDLGEIRNGTVYYRGRNDEVIKRFGHKVNIQNIEATIMLCPKVRTCSCVWLPKPSLLVVYFSSDSFSSQELTNFVRCKLDEKHWPDKIIRVDKLPMSRHGKISKQLLSKIYEHQADTLTSTSQLEIAQREIFMSEINATLDSSVSYDDIKDKDFFAVGGTSFMAVAICNRLSQTHSQFINNILPHILSRNKTIDEILQLASEQRVNNLKRSRPVTAEIESAVIKKSTMISTSKSKSPVEFVVLWKYNTAKCVDASPTLFESKLSTYVTVGSHSGKILAFDTVTQNKLVVSVDSRVEAPVYCFEVRPCEPVGVVGCYDGTVICFELHTATPRWRVNVGAMVKSRATGCGGMVFVAAYDGNLHCIDALTGVIKQRIFIAAHPISADLVLAKQAFILVGTLSGALAGVAAAGARGGAAWRGVAWCGSAGGPVFARPQLYDQDKYVVFAEVGGEIHCRTVEKGIKIWKYQGAKGNIFSSLYVKELSKWKWQMVFGCHDSKVYSIIVKKFQPSSHWASQLQSPIYSTPCVLTDSLILAVANRGCLNVIDSEVGEVIAEYSLPKESFSTPVVHGDTIYIGCRDDNVYAIKYSMT